MKYLEFKKKIDKFPTISSSQLFFVGGNVQLLRNQLTRWEKTGLIVKLKKGMYVLNESDRKIEPTRVFLANQLYAPSYISTEYALGFYGLIPERVADVTSITTRKTYTNKNVFGTFVYQHINIEAFKGFINSKDENKYSFFIALPEKALVDFLYLNLARFRKDDINIFRDSFRFQHLEKLSKTKLREFALCFNNKKLLVIIHNFCKFIGK